MGKKTFLLVFLLSKNELAELLRFLRFCWGFVEVERVKGIEPSFRFQPLNIHNTPYFTALWNRVDISEH